MGGPGAGRRTPRPVVVVGALNLGYEGLPADLGVRRAAQLRTVAAAIEGLVDRPVLDLGIVRDLASAEAIAGRVAAERPAAVVIVCLTAIRADMGWAIVADTAAPVLVWALRDHEAYGPGYEAVDAVASAGPVGAYAVGNVLVRAGRRVSFAIDEVSEATATWLRAASLAADLSEARFGLVGGRWPGMDDVHVEADRLARDLGATWEEVELPEPQAAEPLDLDALEDLGVGPIGFEAGEVGVDLVAASCRLGAALMAVARDRDGLAVRCHSEAVGGHPGYGVMGCLGVSLATTLGIPATCTGDQVTAIAMFLATRLGDASFYGEVDGPDRDRDALLLSNGGEIDLRFARRGSVALVGQRFFSGVAGRGLAFRGQLETGAATLLAFTPVRDAWRLITLEGAIIEDGLPDLVVPHAFLRPLGLSADEAFRRLGTAGTPHHIALTRGHHAAVAAELATIAPIEHVAV